MQEKKCKKKNLQIDLWTSDPSTDQAKPSFAFESSQVLPPTEIIKETWEQL